MSTFIWGKIKYKEMPVKFDNYQREDILVFFDINKNNLYMSNLNEREIYFNIACGYEEMVYPYKYQMHYLNCEETFFSLRNVTKWDKNLEPYFQDLFKRIKKLHSVIIEIFNNPNVEKITYFHTDTGNENSIDNYTIVNWRLKDFADKFFEAIKNNIGFTPTIQIVFEKQAII